jgi:CDP-glycerol glycerophosphotransferase (TagB/SpsB family)
VLRKPFVEEPATKEEDRKQAPHPQAFLPFDAAEETPTLMRHNNEKELNEVIGEQKESLNDRLRQEKPELAHVLKDTPIKDLRKGIGINDKFLFVNELFRGDEAMYERSIKTINSFHILPEAEYWINRELKFKLGWNDNKDTVQHFYHLVRRRFS